MQTLHYPLVVIGSGFAGRTVADYFSNDECLVLERGEALDYAARMAEAEQALAKGASRHEAEGMAYRSDLPWNATPQLSEFNHSRYALVAGGSSNWWGGKCSRFSAHVFESQDFLPWVFNLQDLSPWYGLAEKRLNISGDPVWGEGEPVNAMPGAAYWRNAFAPYLSPSHVYNAAINRGPQGKHGQGTCQGRGACAVCHHDSKARPDNIFRPLNILYRSLVTEIEFVGATAKSVMVYDGRTLFRVTFDRLVIAANGLESPRLLARSALPGGVPRDHLGRYYQDHAHFAMNCRVDKPIAFRNLGGMCHVEVKELSTAYDTSIGSIEAGALALTHPLSPLEYNQAVPPHNVFQPGSAEVTARTLLQSMRGVFQIYCELEIPPQANIRVDLQSEHPLVVDGEAYRALIPILNSVTTTMKQRMADRGVEVLQSHHWYQTGYGGHHFCGTLNMSDCERSVTGADFRLIGTTNVFCAGASIIPRSGGVAPTLTIVALAEKLGQQLRSTD